MTVSIFLIISDHPQIPLCENTILNLYQYKEIQDSSLALEGLNDSIEEKIYFKTKQIIRGST